MRPSKTLLKISVIAVFVLLAGFGLPLRRVQANRSGSPPAHTGAPGELTCAMAGCHTSYAINSGSGKLTLDGLPEGGYVLYQEYDFTVTLTQGQSMRYGFQLTALDDKGEQAGTLSVKEGSQTQLQNGGSSPTRQYLAQLKNGDGFNSWTVHWKAPGNGVGTVHFYVAGLIGNNNNKADGDYVYTLSRTLVQAPIPPAAVSLSSAASFATDTSASEQIVALFGASLASATIIADAVPLPTLLSGVKVRVLDAAKRTFDAPLFFVSWSQINFLMPAGLAAGSATVSVVRADKTIGQGTVLIEDTAPGLFTANANGKGVPAALALRLKADNSQSLEAVAQLNVAGNAFEPAPLDLGPEGEAVYLILYGTGFRNHGGLGNMTCTIGNVNADVFFAGAQGSFAGLDQANLRIPRALIGRGKVNVVFTVNGKTANTVTINVL